VNRLAIRQQYNTQNFPVHFLNRRPAPKSSVCLNHFFHGLVNDVLDPFIPNYRAVGARSRCKKLSCAFHGSNEFLDISTKNPAPVSRSGV
jgi:hypothetical protein